MTWWIYLVPFAAALAGWLLISLATSLLFRPYQPVKIMGISIQGLLPRKQPALAAMIGRQSAELLSVNELAEKVTQPENVKKIMPQAEAHIDYFLRVKLAKSMPMVGMFVGDKTINSLKALFITELEELFPQIMKNYMDNLQKDVDIASIVSRKIASLDPAVIAVAAEKGLKKELRLLKLLGAAICFVMAWLQLVLFLLLVK